MVEINIQVIIIVRFLAVKTVELVFIRMEAILMVLGIMKLVEDANLNQLLI
jgi:hypothetical protein